MKPLLVVGLSLIWDWSCFSTFSPTFRYCDKLQEKRGAVCDKVTAIEKEKQHARFKIQQLKENAEKEEMKAKVRCFCVVFFFFFLKEFCLLFSKLIFNLDCVEKGTFTLKTNSLYRWWFGWTVGGRACPACGITGFVLRLVLIFAARRWPMGEMRFADLREKILDTG